MLAVPPPVYVRRPVPVGHCARALSVHFNWPPRVPLARPHPHDPPHLQEGWDQRVLNTQCSRQEAPCREESETRERLICPVAWLVWLVPRQGFGLEDILFVTEVTAGDCGCLQSSWERGSVAWPSHTPSHMLGGVPAPPPSGLAPPGHSAQ